MTKLLYFHKARALSARKRRNAAVSGAGLVLESAITTAAKFAKGMMVNMISRR
jgi:hypothetical protein